jgi:hypothetical protein
MKTTTNYLNNLINIIASLLAIFNFLLALPSVFDEIEVGYLVKITEKNFALKCGFILILEFGVAYIISILLANAQKGYDLLKSQAVALFLILVSSWLTLFNITEILYSEKITTTYQHFGMLFFFILSILLQGFLIIVSEWRLSYLNYYSSSKDVKAIKKSEDEMISRKIFYICILSGLQLIFFIVYWIN